MKINDKYEGWKYARESDMYTLTMFLQNRTYQKRKQILGSAQQGEFSGTYFKRCTVYYM